MDRKVRDAHTHINELLKSRILVLAVEHSEFRGRLRESVRHDMGKEREWDEWDDQRGSLLIVSQAFKLSER